MNLQEAYNTARTHLLAQKERATLDPNEPDVGCAYRSPNGLKCAIGALIPDELYDSIIEDRGVYGCRKDHPLEGSRKLWEILNELGLSEHIYALHELQRIHDETNPDEWKAELDEFAVSYHLEVAA